jgi:hypothetical protein
MAQGLVFRNNHIFRSNAILAIKDPIWIVFAFDFQKPCIVLAPEGLSEMGFIDIGLEKSVFRPISRPGIESLRLSMCGEVIPR